MMSIYEKLHATLRGYCDEVVLFLLPFGISRLMLLVI
jgi:hypothetical protein